MEIAIVVGMFMLALASRRKPSNEGSQEPLPDETGGSRRETAVNPKEPKEGGNIQNAIANAIVEGMDPLWSSERNPVLKAVAPKVAALAVGASVAYGASMVISGGTMFLGPAIVIVTVVVVVIAIVYLIVSTILDAVHQEELRKKQAIVDALENAAKAGSGTFRAWFNKCAEFREAAFEINVNAWQGDGSWRYIDKTVEIETDEGRKTLETVKVLEAMFRHGSARFEAACLAILAANPWVLAGQNRTSDFPLMGDVEVVYEFLRNNGSKLAGVLPPKRATGARVLQELRRLPKEQQKAIIAEANRERVPANQQNAEDRTNDQADESESPDRSGAGNRSGSGGRNG